MPARPRIVVAEDDAGVRDLIRTRLDVAGYDVRVAHDGLEAIGAINGMRPDAVVLDINMPLLDGFGVLAAMRTGPFPKTMPVLVLTARHAGDDVRRAIQLGAKDYLTKPFNEAQLLARVARLLRRPQAVALEDLAPPPRGGGVRR